MKRTHVAGLCAWFAATGFVAQVAAQQAADPPPVRKEASESDLVEQIKTLSRSLRTDLPLQARLTLNAEQLRDIVTHCDELLQRFPKSSFRDPALLAKLAALADLARARPAFLRQLQSLTAEIATGNPQGLLASENAFYAIQAFVLGARYEAMPDERRIRGTIERYDAFLKDYPASPRRPVIWASLIRDLLALTQHERARAELDKFSAQYPKHMAVRRAAGEVYRATAVGRAFQLELSSLDGKTIRTADLLGKVLIIHFWTSRNKEAMIQLPKLLVLHQKYGPMGLQLLGINVDEKKTHCEQVVDALKLFWPHHFEPRGFQGDLLIRLGVVKIPTVYVVDRRGILRAVDSGEQLPDLVSKLLAEPQ